MSLAKLQVFTFHPLLLDKQGETVWGTVAGTFEVFDKQSETKDPGE